MNDPAPQTVHPEPHPGLVHLYTGDGKGKTTAALGLSFRALGWGMRVCFVQFIKGYADIGEVKIAPRFEGQFEIRQFAIDVSPSIDEAKVRSRRQAAEEAMRFAESAVTGGEYGLVVLDEIVGAIHYGLIDQQRVLDLIASKPRHVELALTGNPARRALIDAADYAAEVRKIKHPYDKGIPARQGIDY